MSESKTASIMKQAFERLLKERYSSNIPPEPIITPLGIRHVDAILGGGITSSSYVFLSSTPETGKSTTALQLCSIFQHLYPGSFCVYIDTESAAGGTSPDVKDRILTFGIDEDNFIYVPAVMNVHQIFDMIENAVKLKTNIRERANINAQLMVVWDSIASTPSSKDMDAEDVNSTIGFKARELSFELNKNKALLAMEQITCIVIDQVRDNINLKMPWQIAAEEKTIGTFGNVKSATNIKSMQHAVRQWLFLSKGQILNPNDPMGIDGWIINIFTEKNKLAPSQYSIPVVFDKKFGIQPLWSEYYFLLSKTKTENKLYPKEKKMPYPLLITGTPTKRVLEVIDPSNGNSMYKAEFSEKKFIEKYQTDETFRSWFNYAVDISVEMRIKQGLFRTASSTGENTVNESEVTEEEMTNMIPDGVTQHTDPETGEVTYLDANGNTVDLGQQINISSVS